MFSKIVAGLTVVVISVAVLWQTVHLIDWCWTLYTFYGNGTLAGYLRMHAYTYVSYIFGGNTFGWTIGGTG